MGVIKAAIKQQKQSNGIARNTIGVCFLSVLK